MSDSRLIRVVAAIIQNQNQEILLSSRPIGKSFQGYWEFAGGKIEADETDIAALKRELIEELGIHIHHATPWLSRIIQNDHNTIHLQFFRVQYGDYTGSIVSKENQEWAWQDPDNITVAPLLPANQFIFNALSMPNYLTGTLESSLRTAINDKPYAIFPDTLHQKLGAIWTRPEDLLAINHKTPKKDIWVLIHHQKEHQNLLGQDIHGILWGIDSSSSFDQLCDVLKTHNPYPILVLGAKDNQKTLLSQLGVHGFVLLDTENTLEENRP